MCLSNLVYCVLLSEFDPDLQTKSQLTDVIKNLQTKDHVIQ